MKKKSTLILLGLGTILALVSSLFTGCSSGDYYGTGYVSTSYGYGMYDPYFYDPWYRHGGGTVIVTPPPSRPVQPVHPIAPVRPTPTPRPMPRPSPR